MKEKKNNKKLIKIIAIVVAVLIVFAVAWVIYENINITVAGKIVDGKVVFSKKISTASKGSTNVIEINSIKPEKLDTVVITDEVLGKIKNNNVIYLKSLKDYIKEYGISNREIYNIQRAIELKIVKETDNYIKFLYKVTGFRNQKQLVEFCENAIELMNKN